MQIEAIKQSLTNIDNDIQPLEKQIQQLQAVITTLKTRKQDLKALAKEHRALLSPARRIYPELLSEIFTLVVHSNVAQRRCGGALHISDCFHPNRGALLFTQICRSWRAVAIGTPELWTNISFKVKPRRRFNLMDMWLERSKTRNLTIAVMDNPKAYSESDFILAANAPCNQHALRLLSNQAHRWESAVFYLPRFKECWDVFAAAQGHIKQLKCLEIYVSRSTRQDYIPDMFSDGSQFRNLTLTDCQFPISHSPVRGAGITQFYYTVCNSDFPPIPIDTFLEVLLCFPNLEGLELNNGVGFAPTAAPSKQLVPLPKLLVLQMQTWGRDRQWDGMADLWQALQPSNLAKLWVHCKHPSTSVQPEWAHLPFLTCIARCPKLQDLSLLSPSVKPEHLIDVFQHIPNVTTLRIALSGTGESYGVLDHLTEQSALPKLSEFGIRLFSETSVTSQTFVDGFVQIAKSRMTPTKVKDHAWLQSAFLDFTWAQDRNLISRILPLIRSQLQPSMKILLHPDSDIMLVPA